MPRKSGSPDYHCSPLISITMVHIYFCRINKNLDDRVLSPLVQQMPVATIERLARYKRWEDYQSHLFGRVLLGRGLEYYGYDPKLILDLKYSPYKRPYLDGRPFDFNISHSGEWVMCALSSQCKIGLDIEKMEPVAIKDFKGIFSPVEWGSIVHAGNQESRFYELWTQKEAVIKANGKGWGILPQDIQLNKSYAFLEEEYWYLEKLDAFKGYSAHFVTDNHAYGGVKMEEVTIP
jgi:4'-phosphopantetheinyl transferase